ncbi:heterotetrameric sarcosine oxidase gamma subunit [Silicimonas algicola]|uniref:Heterotetrameric sarcosine oxidase gamma subunit n=1 Tax=Silicimonas algicola TaxID=1826607 RepID=A0A316GB03_9RHOB|nr:heterotetrameric sarcosine oxidase gamma subunit [Silicimonas algicola]
MALTPMLAPSGRLVGDMSVACYGADDFLLVSSYAAQDMHLRWFAASLRPDEDVTIENLSDRLTGFQLAGPSARELLTRVTAAEVSQAALPFLAVTRATVGPAAARIQRVSYTGDLGFEIYCEATMQRALWQALDAAGSDLGLRPFGLRALMSLRLEKAFGAWGRDYTADLTPGETGLDRFIDFGKTADFIGRAAAEAERSAGAGRRLVAFEVDADEADAVGWEPVWIDGAVAGYCTSGGYAHWTDRSMALALIPAEQVRDGLEAEIEILGHKRRARLVTRPAFDPEGARMRG